MARGNNVRDVTILQMALVGYQLEKQKIEDRIRELQSELKGKRVPLSSGEPSKAGAKRVLSAAARSRIAAAQKKRWAEHRRRKAAAAKQAK
jgi:hypothetical protein